MAQRSIVSPEDQSATFVELFFDLVFVFCVTQIVSLFHHDLSWQSAGRAVLLFWLVWWAWTQFTWALNAADTTHHSVQLGTLVSTAVAFFMATSLPDAFAGRALWFAVPYVLVRVLGLGLYARVAAAYDASQHAAVRTFATLSVGGMVAVIAGAVAGGSTQYWLWGMAILLDVIAAGVGGQREGWNIHPEHFGERHGLFVIIALGETLIVAAGGLRGAALDAPTLIVAILAVGITCAFWWSYFTRTKPEMDRALCEAAEDARAPLGRDVFSLGHFPAMCGVIAYAVAIEHVLAHPADPVDTGGRIALAAGLLLFVGSVGACIWRATGRILLPRFAIAVIAAAAVLLVGPLPAAASLSLVFVALLVLLSVERRIFASVEGQRVPMAE